MNPEPPSLAKTPGYDLMIDIETLGTFYDAPIIQIGVVEFLCPCKQYPVGVVQNPVTFNITMSSALQYGNIEPRTLQWWFNQDPKAISSVILSQPRCHLNAALGQIANMVACNGSPLVWACPPQFDLSILKNAYKVAAGGRQPWSHRNERCLRTLCDITGYDRRKSPHKAKIKHDAGYDALAQASQCIDAHLLYQKGKKNG